MKKTAFLIMLIAILSKFVGFFRELTLAYFYGASYISDAFLIAITIPITILAFISTSIDTAYIPLYNKILANRGEKEAYLFTNNLLNISALIGLLISIITFVYAENIVPIFASGFDEETLALAVRFTRISVISIPFTISQAIISSLLRIKGIQLLPAMVAIPMNISMIFAIIISSRGYLSLLGWGILIASANQLLFFLPSLFKSGFKYSAVLNVKDLNILKLLMLSTPIIIGVAVDDLNKIIDRTIASNLAEGAITSLNYANMVIGIIYGVFILSIAIAIYPKMSEYASQNQLESLKSLITSSITGVIILVIPSIVGYMIFSDQIISLMFDRGAFDTTALLMTSEALFFYSLGILGVGLRELLARPFYAMQDTKTPVINGMLGITLNIILNIILSRILGIGGLALATSISANFTALLLLVNLRKKIGAFGIKKMGISLLKILSASTLMGVISKLVFSYLEMYFIQNVALLVSVAVSLVVYIVLLYFLKIDDIDIISLAIKSKFTGR